MRRSTAGSVSAFTAIAALLALAVSCASAPRTTIDGRDDQATDNAARAAAGTGVGRVAASGGGRPGSEERSAGRFEPTNAADVALGSAGDAPSDPEPTVEPLTVAVVSDMNGSYGSTDYAEPVHRTVDWLTGDLKPDLVLSTGDHVAGQKRGLDYRAMWRSFHRTVTRPLAEAGIPFAPTPGNHDASAAPRYRQERRQFRRQWRAHRPDVTFVDDTHFPTRYAFTVGDALFVSLDATMPGPLSDEQHTWLESVLERADDAATKVVYGHLPLVPFAEERRREILADARLERLLKTHDVDVMFSGHHHAYYPGRRGELRLVGLACLGGGPRSLLGTDRPSPHSAVVMQIEADGSVTIDAHHGPEMQQTIDHSGLPRSLGEGEWRVWRQDVRPPIPRRQDLPHLSSRL